MGTAAESRERPQPRRSGWGGRRPGAGRRPRDADKWITARGLSPATAAEILERTDERRIWYRLLNSEDEAIVLRAVTYLTDRRDGRPAQRIAITGSVTHISAEEVALARQVVREIVQAQAQVETNVRADALGQDQPGQEQNLLTP